MNRTIFRAALLFSFAAAAAYAAPETRVIYAATAPGVVVPWDQASESAIRQDPRGQWAVAATASTQYRPQDYSAQQATGAPDVPAYGDDKRAWSPNAAERQLEWLELTYAQPVHATEVRVRQTFNPGTIVNVIAVEADGTGHFVWKGRDPNAYAPKQIGWFVVRFPKTPYLVQRVRVTLDTPAAKGWKQIDAVQLVGDTNPPTPAEQAATPAPGAKPPPLLAPAPMQAAPRSPGALPPGWKPRAPYDEEKTFVAPQATKRLAEGVRTLSADPLGPNRFKGVSSPRIIIDNPYLDPADPFFNIPRRMACLPDGSLAVFSTAKTHPDGRMKGNPYATGLWRVAPDGAITAIDRARHILSENRDPECGVTVGASGIDPQEVKPISVAPDGSLIFPYATRWAFGRHARVLKVTPQGWVESIPDEPEACAPKPPPELRELFNDIGSAAQDPQGNTWVMDSGRCRLQRVAPDGRVTTVLDAPQVCPKDEPERYVLADHMLWDAARGEMVMGGSLLWTKSPKTDLYSSIWRVRPDGSFRRIYLARKLRKGGEVADGLGGLALDAQGRIVFGAGNLRGHGWRILRLDEATGRTSVLAGSASDADTIYADGPAMQARFHTIRDLCYAPDGTLFVHDANHVIRKITPDGQVSTWAF
jgi:hypothetical protein